MASTTPKPLDPSNWIVGRPRRYVVTSAWQSLESHRVEWFVEAFGCDVEISDAHLYVEDVFGVHVRDRRTAYVIDAPRVPPERLVQLHHEVGGTLRPQRVVGGDPHRCHAAQNAGSGVAWRVRCAFCRRVLKGAGLSSYVETSGLHLVEDGLEVVRLAHLVDPPVRNLEHSHHCGGNPMPPIVQPPCHSTMTVPPSATSVAISGASPRPIANRVWFFPRRKEPTNRRLWRIGHPTFLPVDARCRSRHDRSVLSDRGRHGRGPIDQARLARAVDALDSQICLGEAWLAAATSQGSPTRDKRTPHRPTNQSRRRATARVRPFSRRTSRRDGPLDRA